MLRDREAFQQFSLKSPCKLEQSRCRESVGAARELPSNIKQIHGSALEIEGYVLPIGDDSPAAGLVNERTQPAQRPPKRSTRIVGDLPEQLTEPLPTMTATRKNEVGEQGPGLARLGKVLRGIPLQNREVSQHTDRKGS